MANVTLHAAWSPGEVRVAAMASRTMIDYALWRPGSPDGVGDVYLGRVTAVVPAMAGAFVALASGMPEGFLPRLGRSEGPDRGCDDHGPDYPRRPGWEGSPVKRH